MIAGRPEVAPYRNRNLLSPEQLCSSYF